MPDKSKVLIQLFNKYGQQLKKQMCINDNELTRNLTVSQVGLLHILYYHQKMSMADVANELRITPASATSLADRLVKQGWLTRVADDHDRRKVYIEISREKMPVWEKCHFEVLNRVAEQMNVLSEEQKDQLIKILEILTTEDNK